MWKLPPMLHVQRDKPEYHAAAQPKYRSIKHIIMREVHRDHPHPSRACSLPARTRRARAERMAITDEERRRTNSSGDHHYRAIALRREAENKGDNGEKCR